jgi:serine/threonine-protein kinase RsbW
MALQKALNNSVVHGNGMDAHKLVHVRCRCELGKGVPLIVKDQGQGFGPDSIPDPVAAGNLLAEYGRGIHLMKQAMDEVSSEREGTEVHMRNVSTREQRRISGTSEANIVVSETMNSLRGQGR